MTLRFSSFMGFPFELPAVNASTNVRLHQLMRAFSKLPVAGLLLFQCATASAQAAASDVQVTDLLATRGEVEYEIRSGADCRIRWVVSRTGINDCLDVGPIGPDHHQTVENAKGVR